jgi:hypothetical protein
VSGASGESRGQIANRAGRYRFRGPAGPIGRDNSVYRAKWNFAGRFLVSAVSACHGPWIARLGPAVVARAGKLLPRSSLGEAGFRDRWGFMTGWPL